MRALIMAAFSSFFPNGFRLRNRLFLLRHGLAESNVQGVIVSDPEVGIPAYGLVEEGKKQAKDAAQKLCEMLGSDKEDLSEKLLVVSSDFRRTRETAEIVHECLQVKTPIRMDAGLRERGMGNYHLTSGPEFRQMWVEDEIDPTQTKNNVESVVDIAKRTSGVVRALNEEFENRVLVLVSHQDTLHILHSLFVGTPLNLHRKGTQPPILNCDIRELKTD